MTKIEGGTDAPGNDALASIVLHIREPEDLGVLPADFPGHQGAVIREDGSLPLDGGQGIGGMAKGVVHIGNGTSTDIIVASARACIAAINRAIAHEDKI